jgi:hypothetical protein
VFLLDTNIVSLFDPRRHGLHPGLVPWLRRHGAQIFLSVITLTELESGILKLRRDSKIKRADEYAALRDRIIRDFADRILPVNADGARSRPPSGFRAAATYRTGGPHRRGDGENPRALRTNPEFATFRPDRRPHDRSDYGPPRRPGALSTLAPSAQRDGVVDQMQRDRGRQVSGSLEIIAFAAPRAPIGLRRTRALPSNHD